MAFIKIRENESIDAALRRFKRQVEKALKKMNRN